MRNGCRTNVYFRIFKREFWIFGFQRLFQKSHRIYNPWDWDTFSCNGISHEKATSDFPLWIFLIMNIFNWSNIGLKFIDWMTHSLWWIELKNIWSANRIINQISSKFLSTNPCHDYSFGENVILGVFDNKEISYGTTSFEEYSHIPCQFLSQPFEVILLEQIYQDIPAWDCRQH